MDFYLRHFDPYKTLIGTCIYKKEKTKDIKIAIIIKSGLLAEKRRLGIAHFTEHMLLSFEYENEYHEEFPYLIKATTSLDKTIFEFESSVEYIANLLELIRKILTGETLKENYLNDIKTDVILEFIRTSLNNPQYHMNRLLLKRYGITNIMPIGTPKKIQKITFKMVRNYFQRNYNSSNIGMIVYGNIPFATIEEHINHILRNNIRYKKNLQFDFGIRNINYLIYKENFLLEEKDGYEFHMFYKIQQDSNLYKLIVDNIVFTIIEENLSRVYENVLIDINRFSKNNIFVHLMITNAMGEKVTFQGIRRALLNLQNFIQNDKTAFEIRIQEIVRIYFEKEETMEEKFTKLIDWYLYKEVYYTEEEYKCVLKNISTKDIRNALEKWINKFLKKSRCTIFKSGR